MIISDENARLRVSGRAASSLFEDDELPLLDTLTMIWSLVCDPMLGHRTPTLVPYRLARAS